MSKSNYKRIGALPMNRFGRWFFRNELKQINNAWEEYWAEATKKKPEASVLVLGTREYFLNPKDDPERTEICDYNTQEPIITLTGHLTYAEALAAMHGYVIGRTGPTWHEFQPCGMTVALDDELQDLRMKSIRFEHLRTAVDAFNAAVHEGIINA